MHRSPSNRYSPYLTASQARLRTPSPLQKSDSQSAGPEQPEVLMVNPEEMAAQTDRYMNVFEEHASVVRDYPQAEYDQAYQALIKQERVLPPGTKWPQLKRAGIDILRLRMEAIIERPAGSIVE